MGSLQRHCFHLDVSVRLTATITNSQSLETWRRTNPSTMLPQPVGFTTQLHDQIFRYEVKFTHYHPTFRSSVEGLFGKMGPRPGNAIRALVAFHLHDHCYNQFQEHRLTIIVPSLTAPELFSPTVALNGSLLIVTSCYSACKAATV